jgi:signal transduction histidine kinase
LRFDDRLLTVLNQPATDRHDAAVRWRQLVDLVARAGPNSASPVVAQALESIRSEAPNVEEPLRAAAARAVAALPLPLGLLECFAADRLSVSAPVLAAATLEPAQWRALLAAADDETRRFVEALHPEIAAAADADLTPSLVEPTAEPRKRSRVPAEPTRPAGPSLHEVVARIERRRRTRERQPEGGAGPAVAAGAPILFRWECGPSGEIAWVDGAPRGALIGRSIARPQEMEGERLDEDVLRAFAMRAPFRDGSLSLAGDGAVSGEWKISGIPAFEPSDGRFAGYRGLAMREAPAAAARREPLEILSDPDSLRELVHEIKTPLNAIIGFAEIIDGQFLGPADRRYRERAAEIVAQARLLLDAIDDLDFAAKIHSSNGARRVDLAELLDRSADSLRSFAAERGVEIELASSQRVAPAAVEAELAERLIFRLSTAAIEAAKPRERLRLAVDQAGDHCRFSISRPVALRGMNDAQLFDAVSEEAGAGFALRLVRGLARIAGGDLIAPPAGLTLVFARA